jgi:purine nucleosidase
MEAACKGVTAGRCRTKGHAVRALDTDIGTDVDDLLALLTLWGADTPIDVITTVYGDVSLRAAIVSDAYARARRPLPALIAGAEHPLSGRPIFWAGHEGAALEGRPRQPPSHADPAAARDALRTADEIIAIGPLANVAAAVAPDSGAWSGRVAMMAGDFAGAREHNIICDVEAASQVFASGARIDVIGTDQTTRVRLDRSFLDAVPDTEVGRLLSGEVSRFRRFMADEGNTPHDAIAVVLAEDPASFELEPGRVSVDRTTDGEGRVSFEPDPDGPHRVVRDFDTRAVEERIVRRILAAAGAPAS